MARLIIVIGANCSGKTVFTESFRDENIRLIHGDEVCKLDTNPIDIGEKIEIMDGIIETVNSGTNVMVEGRYLLDKTIVEHCCKELNNLILCVATYDPDVMPQKFELANKPYTAYYQNELMRNFESMDKWLTMVEDIVKHHSAVELLSCDVTDYSDWEELREPLLSALSLDVQENTNKNVITTSNKKIANPESLELEDIIAQELARLGAGNTGATGYSLKVGTEETSKSEVKHVNSGGSKKLKDASDTVISTKDKKEDVSNTCPSMKLILLKDRMVRLFVPVGSEDSIFVEDGVSYLVYYTEAPDLELTSLQELKILQPIIEKVEQKTKNTSKAKTSSNTKNKANLSQETNSADLNELLEQKAIITEAIAEARLKGDDSEVQELRRERRKIRNQISKLRE